MTFTMSDKLGLRMHMHTAPADSSVPRPLRLLDQLRDSLRADHAQAQWVKRYIYFHGKRHLTTARAGRHNRRACAV